MREDKDSQEDKNKRAAKRKKTADSPKGKKKKRGGVITAITSGVTAAVAIPVFIYFKSQNESDEVPSETFNLTIEW